jgi:hypothetical protein
MLRILNATLIDKITGDLLSHEVLRVSTRLAGDFLSSSAGIFFRDVQNDAELVKRDQELQRLYQSAEELSLSLWSQRTSMECKGLEALPVFNDNGTMRAHRLHQLDEDDDRLNGKNVLVVIQPLVVAYGTEDAEDYDKEKTWARAIVLIEEEH